MTRQMLERRGTGRCRSVGRRRQRAPRRVRRTAGHPGVDGTLSMVLGPNPRGGDRGESTVKVGASCGDEWKFIDMGLLCLLPGDLPGEPLRRENPPFVRSYRWAF